MLLFSVIDLTSTPTREVSEILSMGEVIQYLIDVCSPFTEVKHSIFCFNLTGFLSFLLYGT